jgi:hypothetical protein
MKLKACGTCEHWQFKETSPGQKLGYCGYDYHNLRLPFWMVDMAREKWSPMTGPDVGTDCQIWQAIAAPETKP